MKQSHRILILVALLAGAFFAPATAQSQSMSFQNVAGTVDGASPSAAGSQNFSLQDGGVMWRTAAGQSGNFQAGGSEYMGDDGGGGAQSSHGTQTGGGGGYYRPRFFPPAPSVPSAPAPAPAPAPTAPSPSTPPPAPPAIMKAVTPVRPTRVPVKPPGPTLKPLPRKTQTPTAQPAIVKPNRIAPGSTRTGPIPAGPRTAAPARPSVTPSLLFTSPRPAVPAKNLSKTKVAPSRPNARTPAPQPDISQQRKPARRPFAWSAAILESVGTAGSAILGTEWSTLLGILLILTGIAWGRRMMQLRIQCVPIAVRRRHGRRGRQGGVRRRGSSR